jgi:cystathionine beta-synthase
MTRRITREEGIFAGNSAGAAMAGLLQLRDRFTKDDVVVVIFHDHGTRYLGKMFNDDWMREKGFLEKTGLTARDLVVSRRTTRLVTLDRADTVARAVQIMTEHDYSQIPVTDGGRIVGAVSETRLYAAIVANPDVKAKPIDTIMQPAFPFVDISAGLDALATMITPETPAVLVRDFKSQDTFIITRWDVMQAIS